MVFLLTATALVGHGRQLGREWMSLALNLLTMVSLGEHVGPLTGSILMVVVTPE